MSQENRLSDEKKPDDGCMWTPGDQRVRESALTRFMQQGGQSFDDYDALWRWSIDHPEAFWSQIWDFCGVIGDKGETILENPVPMETSSFFTQARLNYAENLLRRRDESPAIFFRGENGAEECLSFNQLYNSVRQWRAAFENIGIGKGDRVAGYLPNIPQAVIAALAAASLGAIWSSASPDFGAQGVLDRFGQISPKLLITVDGYNYNGKIIDCRPKIAEIADKLDSLESLIVCPFAAPDTDISLIPDAVMLDAFLAPFAKEKQASAEIPFERVDFDHPLFIMFSSGTTGKPKCILHGHGGALIQHLKEHQLHCDIRRDERVFYFTTTGWMMWNWLISALASEAAIMLFDGSPFFPGPEILWEYADQQKFTLFGTGAKYIDALRNQDIQPGESYQLEKLKTLCSTGSPLVHESFDYIYTHIKSDIHLASISGGTDIISCFVLGNPVSPVYRGEIQGAGLGMAVDVFDESGRPVPPGQGSGELVCTKAFPSMPVGFWDDPEGARYHAAYFESFDHIWAHGDWIEKTPHGGFIIHGRSDATLNPGGVRIGTSEIYRQVEKLPQISESLAVGQKWDHDERVVLFVTLNEGEELDEALVGEIKKQIRSGASPRHVPAKIIKVPDIPRTKSGKIVELAVRHILHGREVKNIEALANPEALEHFRDLPELQES